MRIAEVDLLATSGQSLWHMASPLSKIGFTLVAIAVSISMRDPSKLAMALSILALLNYSVGVPPRRLLAILVLPAVFATVFAIGAHQLPVEAKAIVILRSMASAAAMTLLVCTTCIFDISARVARVSPIISDALLLTYRSLFLLSEKVERLLLAMRLKGNGTRGSMLFNITHTGGAIGATLVRAVDTSERMRKVLALRGYSPGIEGSRITGLTPYDAFPSLLGLLLAVGAFVT